MEDSELTINFSCNVVSAEVYEKLKFTGILFVVCAKCDVAKLHSVTSNSTTVPCMAFLKVYNAPLQSQRPIGSQLQALTLSLGGDSSGEDGVRSFFTQLQQLTRHLYAPVVRAAGQTIEVKENYFTSHVLCKLVNPQNSLISYRTKQS